MTSARSFGFPVHPGKNTLQAAPQYVRIDDADDGDCGDGSALHKQDPSKPFHRTDCR